MKKMVVGVAAAIAAFGALARDVHVWYVGPEGTDDNTECSAQNPGSLRAAVALAKQAAAESMPTGWADGDTIIIKTGLYDLTSTAIVPQTSQPGDGASGTIGDAYLCGEAHYATIRSETGNPADVVFKGRGVDSTDDMRFAVWTGAARFIGITVREFHTSNSGGAFYGRYKDGSYESGKKTGSTMPCFSNCWFIANSANGKGGAYANRTGFTFSTIDCCTFISNMANEASAVYHQENGARIYDCNFHTNFASTTSCVAGGVKATISKCRFIGNVKKPGAQAGASHSAATSYTALEDSYFEGNDRGCQGGARRCTFVNNTSTHGYGGAGWTGSYYDCTFIGNSDSGTGKGSALCNVGSSHKGVISNCFFTGHSSSVLITDGDNTADKMVIYDCVFSNNAAQVLTGSANTNSMPYKSMIGCRFYENGKASAAQIVANYQMSGCTFVSNVVKSGGVIANANCSLTNCLIYGNSTGGRSLSSCTVAGSQDASGAYLGTGALVNTLFADNVLDIGAGAVVNLTNCLYRTVSDTATVSSAKDCTVISENREAGLRFEGGAVRITLRSKARDRGLAQDWMVAAPDLYGHPRIVGLAPDIGCYEYVPSGSGLLLMVR